MAEDMPLEELLELWRSFFQDSRFRPPRGDSSQELLPTPYHDHIPTVARDFPDGDRAIRVTWEAVSDFSPRLSNNLRWNLDRTLQAAQEAVQEFIDEETKQHVREEHRTELVLDVTPVDIPDELYTEEVRDLRNEHLYRMVKVRGLVRKSLPVRPRMEIGLFECSWERHRQRVVQDFFTMREPERCSGEGCKCTEFRLREELSQFIDSQKLEIQEFPEDLPPGAQPERLTIFAESSLAAQAQPGDRIAVIGILRPRARFQGRRRRTEFDIYLYAHSIDERRAEAEAIEPTPEEVEAILELSRHPDLRERLSGSIAPSIYGMEWQKDAIALQLFGGVSKELPDGTRIRGDIHVLMMGDPGLAKSQLLRAAARLAPRGIMATGKSSSAAGLTAAAVRDEFGEGRWTLEAGTLVLASGGLACIDEIDKMTEDDRSAIHEAMEQQTVTIAKAGINAQLHAKCSLLAAANPKMARFDMTRPLPGQVNMPVTLLSRFDIFFIIIDQPNPEYDARLAEQVLESHRAGEVLGSDSSEEELERRELEPPVNHKLLRRYVGYARKLRPVMTAQAQQKIAKHYTTMRRQYQPGEREEQVFPITPRQLESMIRLAEADARMHLSHTVGPEHAERAIEIMNLFINVTLQGDVGLAFSGLTASQRKQAENPLTLIMQFIRKSGAEGADELEIYDHLENQGFSHSQAEKTFQQLRNDGRVFESPRAGRWRPA